MSADDRRGVELLVVEDNPRDAELIVRAIRRRLGACSLHVSPDGADAVDFVRASGAHAARQGLLPPKAIFLDLKMPRVSGLEVLDAIRAGEQTRTIPVVVVTSSKQDADIRAAYDRGANSYIVKPVDFDNLTDTLGSAGAYWLAVNQPPR
jgi:two-component system response regulator